MIGRKNYMSENYGNYMSSIDWSYICTFTTDYKMTKKSARRLMERLNQRLKTKVFLCTKDYLLFWCAEKFKLKDGYHLHSLIKKPNSYLFDAKPEIINAYQTVSAAKKTNKTFRVDISDYNPNLLGAKYFSKDLLKPNTTYDFLN